MTDYQSLLVRQRGEEGLLDRYTPEQVGGRTASGAKQEQDAADLERQIAAGAGRIPAPPSVIRGGHPDLRGMDNPMKLAEVEADYADAARSTA